MKMFMFVFIALVAGFLMAGDNLNLSQALPVLGAFAIFALGWALLTKWEEGRNPGIMEYFGPENFGRVDLDYKMRMLVEHPLYWFLCFLWGCVFAWSFTVFVKPLS